MKVLLQSEGNMEKRLVEIDISDYKNWKINHIAIGWRDDEEGKEMEKTEIAIMNGKFEWTITKTQRDKLGEGLE